MSQVAPICVSKEFQNLRAAYIKAGAVCPPDEYALRQRQLLFAIGDFLIYMYGMRSENDDS